MRGNATMSRNPRLNRPKATHSISRAQPWKSARVRPRFSTCSHPPPFLAPSRPSDPPLRLQPTSAHNPSRRSAFLLPKGEG